MNKVLVMLLLIPICGLLTKSVNADKVVPDTNYSSVFANNKKAGRIKTAAAVSLSRPYLQWHTFLGGGGSDAARGIALDKAGNAYIVGTSNSSWGDPQNSFAGNNDAFVAKFNAGGILQWHTFLGGNEDDDGVDIMLDAAGNIFVAGTSRSSWGSPKQPFSGGSSAFIAKMTAGGDLLWHIFYPGSAKKIHVDASGNIIMMFASGTAQVVKLDARGNIIKILLPYYCTSARRAMDMDHSGNMFFAGFWAPSMESCIHGEVSAYNADGSYKWGDDFGCEGYTVGDDVTTDGSGNAYITGISDCNPPSNKYDAFVAKFSQWHRSDEADEKWITYLGGSEDDYGSAIAVDDKMNSYVAGCSKSSWGEPLRSFSGQSDVFVAQITEYAGLGWNTFLGGNADDFANGIAVDNFGNIYVLGTGNSSWGEPLNPFSGGSDAFLVKLHNSQVSSESITLASPKGGEEWTVGTIHDITWKSTGKVAKVRIEISIDNAATWSDVIAATANDGSYSWTIPYTPSRHCRVRISAAADAAVSDTSNATFDIAAGSLELLAERREIKAFSIVRQYGQIQFMAENSNNQVVRYLLLRRQGIGEFVLLREIVPSELQDNRFQIQDRYLDKGIQYTYVVEAYNESGQVVGRSAERMI